MTKAITRERIISDYGVSDVVFSPCYGSRSPIDATLVLEGGSMRSLYSAGVLDVFLEHGLLFTDVIGVSAGALMGYNYVGGLIGRGAYLNMKYCSDWRYFSLRSFAATGNMYNREMAFDLIPNVLDPFPEGSVANSPMRLTAVATDLSSGCARYYPVKEEAYNLPLMASSSMPLVSQAVDIDAAKLLDGGCADGIPVRYALLQNPRKVVVICTNDRFHIRDSNPLLGLMAVKYRSYPAFVDTMARRPQTYNETYRLLDTLHRQKEAFVLWPSEPVTVKSDEHDPEALLALYTQGAADALATLDALEAYLQTP